MLKNLLFLLLLLTIPFPLTQASPGQTPGQMTTQKTTVNNLIGTIKNSNAVDGCGCSLQTLKESKNPNSNRFIFFSDIDEVAFINLDGKDVKLKLISKVDYKGKERVGKKFSRKYVAGNATVLVEYVITSVCAPNDESCEVTGHSGTITVTKDSRMQKLTKLTGGCGC
jgi:hypothetical protein